MSHIIGIDVGGTFTDLVAVDAQRARHLREGVDHAGDLAVGLFDGLDELARRLDVTRGELLRGAQRVIHGTTVATNALLERKGARVGLLTTEGHRDILEMREGLKEDRYNLRMPPPVPLVPRSFAARRSRADGCAGRGARANRSASLPPQSRGCGEEAVEAVAICFLHSYRNPAHEEVAADAVRSALPGVFVSTSHEVYPQIKEYERTSTTMINAYVGPKLATLPAESGRSA